jgi:hypothetical protein
MPPDRLKEQFASKTEPATEAQTDKEQTAGVSRRDFIQGGLVVGVTAGLAASALVAHHDTAHAQPASPQAANPFGEAWWPSPWGPADERGAANRITPAKVLEAVKLIKTGKIYQLGRLYEQGMPLFGSRHYSLMIPGGPSGPTGGPFGTNRIMYNDEMFSGEIGQIGTQFDGLGHIATLIGMSRSTTTASGNPRWAVPMASRSSASTMSGSSSPGESSSTCSPTKAATASRGYVITPADVQGALAHQGTREPGEEDVVLFHTGHSKLWMKDNAEFNKGYPGIGVTTAKWLIEQKVCLVGADSSVEAVPGEDQDRAFECHQWLITMNGIYLHENLDLEQLAADRVYEFAYIFSPLRLKGATGSPGNPIAVV